MKKINLVFIFILCLQFLSSQNPSGLWKTVDDETGETKAFVRVYESKGMYFGKIEKLLKKPKTDTCFNCEGFNRNKPYIGMLVIYNMKKDGDEWNGKVYKADQGKEFRGSMKMNGNDRLMVTGKWMMISRTQIWIRVK